VKKAGLIGILVLLAVVGALYYSTASLAKYHVEVCMEFRGQNSCAKASGPTEESTRRSATTTACATIASGVTDSIACDQTTPQKVTWLK
jgi:hypothetical protein